MGKTPGAEQAAEKVDFGPVSAVSITQGLKRLRKKARGWVLLDISARQGLKPDPLLSAVCGTTKVMPCYKASSGRSFFAACPVAAKNAATSAQDDIALMSRTLEIEH
jgi:hypothetical protein